MSGKIPGAELIASYDAAEIKIRRIVRFEIKLVRIRSERLARA